MTHTLTITLPTYADGDPKAGEPVMPGDIVWPLDHDCGGLITRYSVRVSMFSKRGDTTLVFFAHENVPEFGELEPGTLYFSTEEAREEAVNRLY